MSNFRRQWQNILADYKLCNEFTRVVQCNGAWRVYFPPFWCIARVFQKWHKSNKVFGKNEKLFMKQFLNTERWPKRIDSRKQWSNIIFVIFYFQPFRHFFLLKIYIFTKFINIYGNIILKMTRIQLHCLSNFALHFVYFIYIAYRVHSIHFCIIEFLINA